METFALWFGSIAGAVMLAGLLGVWLGPWAAAIVGLIFVGFCIRGLTR